MQNRKIKNLLENTGDMALKRRAMRILTELEPKPGEKILDVGCGDGYYIHLVSQLQPEAKIFGTDFDSAGLKKAKINVGSLAKLSKGDLMKKLPFPDQYFDKAIMSEVAEHLPNDIRGLQEVRRVLKKKAVLCLTVPNASYPFFWDPLNWLLEKLFNTHINSGFFAGLWNQHIRLYKTADLSKIIEKSGFSVDKIEQLTFWCLPFNHYIVNLVARYLHRQYLRGKHNESLNKFSKVRQKPKLIKLAFWLVNKLDELNDRFPVHASGVSIFVKAVRK